MKNKILAGNWKMNKTRTETEEFFNALIPLVKDAHNKVILCVPFTSLCKAIKLTKGTAISIGAQNCHFAPSGAYTGEISTAMLADLGVEYVIIGHSERRQYYNETNESVNKKIRAALESGLRPIVCVGESLAEREAGQTNALLKTQIEEGLEGICKCALDKIIIAYEPIWAIGTGVTATKEQAQETIAFIRSVVESLYGAEAAEAIYIQYGGSMNEKNAADLLSMPDIDGGLIGGASLVPEKFSAIVHAK